MPSSEYEIYPEQILNLQPNFPPIGITCEGYITDFQKIRSFFDWINEVKVENGSDRLIKQFLNLPSDVRQAGHKRIFGTAWEFKGTYKSMYLASLAFFRPDASFLKDQYLLATNRAKKRSNQLLKQRKFLEMISG